MMRFTHSICVTVSGSEVPKNAPSSTLSRATTLMVSWNTMKRWMFLYNERPHITAVAMLWNESSSSVMSLASLATEVPVPIDRPTCAWFRAGASLVPSPVTATTAPFFCSSCTRRCLSIGRARLITFRSSTRSRASSSLNAANSVPVMRFRSVSVGCQRPICRAISVAVPGVSPVTIFTLMPADWHFFTASGTSGRIGSLMAKMPRNVMPPSATSSEQSVEAFSSTYL